MDTFWAAATSLYQFWYRFFSRLLLPETLTKASLIAPANKSVNPSLQSSIDIEQLEEGDTPAEFKTIKSVVENRLAPIVERKPIPLSTNLSHSTSEPREAVVTLLNTPMFQSSTKEFDGVIKSLPYGATLEILDEKRAWAQVKYQKLTGWVTRDAITTRVAQARPYFVIKEYCGPDSENTKRLRAMIADVFSGGEAGLPLHSEEYIYYKLFSRGIVLPDVEDRPRVAGSWQKLFKGVSGTHISVRPKTGSIMEYVTEEDEGHVAYVEAVFPDESISLSEVGIPTNGYYNERMLSKEVWQELKPVFLQFS